MPRIAVAWIVAVAIGEAGCAMIMQQPPKKNRAPGEIPVCSTSRGGVVLDGLLATVLGAGALVAFGNDEAGGGVALGAVAGVYGYSALSGHRSASDCEDALRDYKTELTARQVRPDRPAVAAPVAPAGPPAEAAEPAPPAEEPAEEPVASEPPADEPPAPPPPRDWSDFWVEVKK